VKDILSHTSDYHAHEEGSKLPQLWPMIHGLSKAPKQGSDTITLLGFIFIFTMFNVADPNPDLDLSDPYVFGPPGSVTIH
jgi:hypothetical protein